MKDRESELKRLSIEPYEEIEKEAVAHQRDLRLADLDAAGVTGMDRYRELRRAADQWLDVFNYLATVAGARRVIVKSATLAGWAADAAEQFASSYDQMDATNLARSLVGFEARVNIDELRDIDVLRMALTLVRHAASAGKVSDDWLKDARTLAGTPDPNSPASPASSPSDVK